MIVYSVLIDSFEVIDLLHHLVNCICSSLSLDKDHECTTQLHQSVFSCTEGDHDPAAALDLWDRITYEHTKKIHDTNVSQIINYVYKVNQYVRFADSDEANYTIHPHLLCTGGTTVYTNTVCRSRNLYCSIQ